jgi:putative peptide zinc metalloprotease protein
MNLTRALDVALPEIPARRIAEQYPRMDPEATFREHIEDNRPMVRIYIPSCKGMYTLPPDIWRLTQMFDGVHSYKEIAEAFSQESNVEFDEETVRQIADDLESNEFWYKTPQEKNILLLQQSKEERQKKMKVKSKWADLSNVTFPAFNPDRFLTWFYGHTKFVYTAWFTVLTLILFLFCAVISVIHWNEIWRDTIEFYNFSNKTWGDVFALYTLGMFVVAVHEFAHAHACKHYGGRVPAMGFALVYLMPAFYTDTTEGFVKGTRHQRFIIAMSGIWSELILYAIATPIWLDTPPDTLVHDGAHFVMMMTGLMSLIVNWNPLMKLDGYYMLCEVVGIRDIKEDSTAFVSGLVKKHIWGLPVEVPYVPKRRRLGFAVYALLSGAYSYTVLYIVARFAGNFVRNFSPEWGFIPEIGVALLIFRSRIRLLVNFMKFIYLDKKDRILAWFTTRNTVAATVAVSIFAAFPLWRESVSGKFVLEPVQSAIVRAHVPGTVTSLEVEEGQQVKAGQRLAVLRNLSVESEVEGSRARLGIASERVRMAALRYNDLGPSLKEAEHLSIETGQFAAMNAALNLESPITGTVITPKVQNALGTYLSSGQELLEIADLSQLRARIYVLEWDLSKVKQGAAAKLQVDGFVGQWRSTTNAIAARPVEMDPRLAGGNALKGLNAPHYYQVDLQVSNEEAILRPGMTGLARIYGPRRSVAGMLLESLRNFWGRKLW